MFLIFFEFLKDRRSTRKRRIGDHEPVEPGERNSNFYEVMENILAHRESTQSNRGRQTQTASFKPIAEEVEEK